MKQTKASAKKPLAEGNSDKKKALQTAIAQIEKEKLLSFPYIDYVFGNEDKFEIAKYLKNGEEYAVRDLMSESRFYKISLADTTKTRISLKI